MSEFERLMDGYKQSHDRHWAYIDKCQRFCADFLNGLAKYLQCERSRIENFVRKSKDDEPKKSYGGAGRIDDEGWYECLFQLRVPLGESSLNVPFLDLEAGCTMRIKLIADSADVTVKLECFTETIEQTVQPGNLDGCYAALVNCILKVLASDLDNRLGSRRAQIGFHAPPQQKA